jgi:diguanylate cyclase (GGDEF)-like protein
VRTGRTLLYETTERADVCSHLRSRLHEPASAVAVPVSVAGRALGVLYGFGPENDQPGPGDVEFLEDIAHVIAARIAILRSGAVPAPGETVDRLTGLPDRRTMQKRLVELLHDRVPFAVAVADIDGFGAMNDQRGRDAGDVALQLLGQVARRSLRPDDLLGRIGGDEFLIVFPNSSGDEATRAVERIREELVLGQSTAQCPQFTLSIGVIDSTCGSTIEELLHRAASALEYARNEGGNRVVVGHAAPHTPSGRPTPPARMLRCRTRPPPSPPGARPFGPERSGCSPCRSGPRRSASSTGRPPSTAASPTGRPSSPRS